jgi:hypothetical protein
VAGKDLRKEAMAGERACVEGRGRGLVEDAWPARAVALLALCRDEARLGKDAKVRADGVPVQTDARSKLTGVEGRLGLLQGFENPHAAWVTQSAVEFRAELSGCLGPCHDQIVPASWS